MMKHSTTIFLFLFLLAGIRTVAQKPFMEGVIVYNVTLESADHQEFKGVYTFIIKGSEIKKELKLNNGYQDIVLLDCGKGTVYSLQSKYGKKYAIQLSMGDLAKEQEKFAGYTVNDEQANSRSIAGFAASKGNVNYKNGSVAEIYYTKEWSPVQSITYERFPGSKFLPLSFSYTDDQGYGNAI